MGECKVEPIRGNRYIEELVAHDLIGMVLPTPQLPFCCHAAATHASGTSVAALAARAMRANLNFFRNQVDICWMELMWERDHGLPKLKEHLDILGSLNLLLFSLTADRDPDFGIAATDQQNETKNVVALAFSRLPQEHLRRYNEGVIQLRHMLENEILSKMMRLASDIELDSQNDWESTIRSFLLHEVAPVLERMYDGLTDLLTDALSPLFDKVRGDFEHDVIQIGKDGHAPKKKHG